MCTQPVYKIPLCDLIYSSLQFVCIYMFVLACALVCLRAVAWLNFYIVRMNTSDMHVWTVNPYI